MLRSDLDPRPQALDGTVGYVLKVFPRLSETFVLTEILAREAAGESIAIASLRAPTDGRFHAALADLRASVDWIAPAPRHAADIWTRLAEARDAFGDRAFEEALPALLAASPDDALQAIAVAQWAIAHGVAHLHAHFATTATSVVRLAARLSGLPYSFTAHAKDIYHESVDDRALAGAVRSADHVVTVSDYNVAELRRRLPPDCVDRIHRVYNGLDLDVLPFRTQHAGEPATLLAAGRLVEKKGFADLIDALAILRDRGRALPATIVGGGRLDADLRAQVDACGLTDLVTFTGPMPQDATHDLMRRATVFAAPVVVAPDGDRDGLPTVLLEAMALGTPVVTTGVTGIPEAVQDGRTGLVVPERAPYALADAIERLLDDAALRTRLVTNARVLVEREFTASRQARELAALRAGRTRIARAAAPMAVPA